MEYSIFVLSNKPHLFPNIESSISPEKVEFFDGTGYPSFSMLVNKCVESAPTEIVILMSDKVTPTPQNVRQALDLVDKGYGLVGLHRFGFIAFKKELFRTIGPMDERYVGGGYEDDDFYIRLKEANIGIYISEDVVYDFVRKSSWRFEESLDHFVNKWILDYDPNKKLNHHTVQRKLNEEIYNYDFGPSIPTKFLDWSHSYSTTSKATKYAKIQKL